ncbi:MAG TPA: hypothetical protein PKD75_03425 [Tepidiformaceae bacterium]|nr:hypothetical protein [Tepidiformaceae bacterium]
MTPDRLDALLSETLATGSIPEGATPDERARLEELLASVSTLRRGAEAVRAEADAAMPVARARFQRHLAAQQRPAPSATPPPTKTHAGFFGGFLGGVAGSLGALRLSASVAAIAVVALAAILLARPFSGAETASALSVDDYVQVQGVVAETAGDFVTVQSSEFGTLRVGLSDTTSIVDRETVRDRSELRPGDAVLVSGVVRDARKKHIRIEANTLALASAEPGTLPALTPLKELRTLDDGLEGTITVLALAPDGRGARILVDAGRGHQLIVNVDRASAERFVADSTTALGSRVRIVRDDSLPRGVFRFEAMHAPGGDPPPGGGHGVGGMRPELVRIEGVLTAREGERATVETGRGPVTVLVRPLTRILAGQSGLTLEDIRAGERAIGHEITVRGGFDRDQDAVIADVVVIGPRAGQ